MKKISHEIRKNYLVFSLCLLFFIAFNIVTALQYIGSYKGYLDDYRVINDITISYNNSKSHFLTYSRNHDNQSLSEFEKSSADTFNLMDRVSSEVQNDRTCLMMYRIVYQMLEYRQKLLQEYVQHGRVSINDIEELNFQLERNLNLLTTGYLDFTSSRFDSYSDSTKYRILAGNALTVLLALFSFVMNSSIYRNFMTAIRKLTSASTAIANQQFDHEDIEDGPYEEINFVNHTFNNMKQRIRDMIDEINKNYEVKEKLSEQLLENETQKRRLAEAKMRELQMQINPHFIFNTLSLVIRSIQLGEYDTSIQLIKSTSHILRTSIETKNELILLDDELELLEQYLYIQRIHCKGRIQIDLDVKKSYMDNEVKIPPLTLEPLVENAIGHGLKDAVSDGHVEILVKELPDQILISVSDNGNGMSPEIIRRLKNHESMKQIGLSNVYERLYLIYHREEVMEIDTSENGTTVRLHMFKTTGE